MATSRAGHFGLCAASHVVKVSGRGLVLVLTQLQRMAAQIVQERYWMSRIVIRIHLVLVYQTKYISSGYLYQF
jgi:hypothetical protein